MSKASGSEIGRRCPVCDAIRLSDAPHEAHGDPMRPDVLYICQVVALLLAAAYLAKLLMLGAVLLHMPAPQLMPPPLPTVQSLHPQPPQQLQLVFVLGVPPL